jgi:drug/metabolite transporter (DMT)-like permease
MASGEASRFQPSEVSTAGLVALAFLIVGGTVIGLCAHNWLLRAVSPTAVGSYAFVTPLVALALGAIAGDEVLTPTTAASALLVVLSLALLRMSAAKRSTPQTTANGRAPQLVCNASAASRMA